MEASNSIPKVLAKVTLIEKKHVSWLCSKVGVISNRWWAFGL